MSGGRCSLRQGSGETSPTRLRREGGRVAHLEGGSSSISQMSPLKSPSTKISSPGVAIGAVPCRYAGISISVEAYTATASLSIKPDAGAKCRARTALRISAFVPVGM